MIIDAIAQWQYLIMGATGCTLLAIALMAIYIADLHHKLNQVRESNAAYTAWVQAEMDMVRRQVQKQEERAYWRGTSGTLTQ